MEIYVIYVNGEKKSNHKSFEDALKHFHNLIFINKEFQIEILCEDYCDIGHEDTCCKIYLLLKYLNGKINKYI